MLTGSDFLSNLQVLKEEYDKSPKEVMSKLELISNQISKMKEPELRAENLLNLGKFLLEIAQNKEAYNSLQLSLKLYEKQSNNSKIIYCYYFIGVSSLRLNIFDEARKYFLLAYNTTTEVSNNTIYYNSAIHIGRINNELGHYDAALKYLFIALKGYKENNNKENIAGAYSNIGISYNDIGFYDKSIEYHLKAVELCIKLKKDNMLVSVYINLGSTYQNSGNYDSALDYYYKGLEISKEKHFLSKEIFCLNNIGEVYSLQQKTDYALKYFLEAYEILSVDDKYPMASIMFNLSQVYFVKEQFEMVFKYLNKAIELAEELNVKKMKLDIYKGAKDIYFKLEDYKKAYEYQQKYYSLELTVLNTETSKQIANIQVKQSTFPKSMQKRVNSFNDVDFVGNSDAMQDIFSLINVVGEHNVSVLITGSTGTGKELVARALHKKYKKGSPFVAINCSAIPEHLLESELFGHVKGAFTGAIKDKKGKIESANNGTLFLDEIGDMPFSFQAKILRVLQERLLTPVGSSKSIPISIRVISATNKDLAKAIEVGEFREDLFFRLNVINIKIPDLKDRKLDIPLLINYFIRKFNYKFNKSILGVSVEALNFLMHLPWLGNVRELENIVEKAILLSPEDVLGVELFVTDTFSATDNILENLPMDWVEYKQYKNSIVSKLDSTYVKELLDSVDNNVQEASKKGGLERAQIYRLLKKKR